MDIELIVKTILSYCKGLAATGPNFLTALIYVLESLPTIVSSVRSIHRLLDPWDILAGTLALCVLTVLITKKVEMIKVCPEDESVLNKCLELVAIKIQKAKRFIDEIQVLLQVERHQATLSETNLNYLIINVSHCLKTAEGNLEDFRQDFESLINSKRPKKEQARIAGGFLLAFVSIVLLVLTDVVVGVCFVICIFDLLLFCCIFFATQPGFQELDKVERNSRTKVTSLRADLEEQLERYKRIRVR